MYFLRANAMDTQIKAKCKYLYINGNGEPGNLGHGDSGYESSLSFFVTFFLTFLGESSSGVVQTLFLSAV